MHFPHKTVPEIPLGVRGFVRFWSSAKYICARFITFLSLLAILGLCLRAHWDLTHKKEQETASLSSHFCFTQISCPWILCCVDANRQEACSVFLLDNSQQTCQPWLFFLISRILWYGRTHRLRSEGLTWEGTIFNTLFVLMCFSGSLRLLGCRRRKENGWKEVWEDVPMIVHS